MDFSIGHTQNILSCLLLSFFFLFIPDKVFFNSSVLSFFFQDFYFFKFQIRSFLIPERHYLNLFQNRQCKEYQNITLYAVAPSKYLLLCFLSVQMSY